MLHEVLLSLSGFPSPLFDASSKTGAVAGDFPLISPPEAALLSSIGQLALRHRQLRDRVKLIASSHPSTICRAVASSISSVHLARFQQKVLDVEASILKKDASTVAAYDIVPLAGVVEQFDGWKRRMGWLWEFATFILPINAPDKASDDVQCTGAQTINRLRKEAQTGYPEIEEMAIELGKVAETAWLRQLSSWVLYGKLPSTGTADFAVQSAQSDDGNQNVLDRDRLPNFVSEDTGDSILFIGRSLHQIRTRGLSTDHISHEHIPSETELLPVHLQHLTTIKFPITSAGITTAISAIRTSLSQNTLQRLLPLPKITEMLALLYDFFLLGRGEFAGILISEEDSRFDNRTKGISKPSQGVVGLVPKDSELSALLSKSFATLSTITSDEHDEDDSHDAILELARSTIRLQVDRSAHRPKDQIMFNDLLLAGPANLALKIASPMDLFLSPLDLATYSRINAYLLSIERAHMHLASLWRLTSIRREHPCPAGPPTSTTPKGRSMLKKRRERRHKREVQGRKVWATISKAVYFLTELTMHLEGTVVKSAWQELHAVVTGQADERPTSAGSTMGSLQNSVDSRAHLARSLLHAPDLTRSMHTSRPATPVGKSTTTRDPSSLAALHQAYLSSLTEALLLNNDLFVKELKPLLISIENVVAQMKRLETVQTNLDLEEDDGIVDSLNDWAKEEQGVLLELDRARKKVDEGLRACIDVLGQTDLMHDRALLPTNNGKSPVVSLTTHSEWKWRAPAVDRLLMKLEFGNMEAGSDANDSP